MFFYHSATKGMIRSNLDAFFTAKSDGMSLEEALGFMIGTRYSLFPEKKVVFFRLYALFQEYIEDEIDLFKLDNALSDVLLDASTEAMDHVSDAFGELIVVLRFHAPEIPNNVGEKETEELKMLRSVISLMFLYESGAIFKSTKSFSFPTDKWMADFIQKIDKEYCEKLERKKVRIEQKSSTSSKFKNREEYEAWKAGKLKEAEEKRKSLIDQYYRILGLKPNASKEEVDQAYKDLLTVWNPDAFADEPGLQQKAREKVKEIDEAYKKLILYLSNSHKQTTRIQPDDVDAYYKLGVKYEKIGMYKEAIEEYKRAIKIKPDYAKANYGLGVAYLYSGQKGKALEQYQELKKINKTLAEELFKQIYK